jgi:hypothetical protein
MRWGGLVETALTSSKQTISRRLNGGQRSGIWGSEVVREREGGWRFVGSVGTAGGRPQPRSNRGWDPGTPALTLVRPYRGLDF